MILPLIDIASLPSLDMVTGVFGSLIPQAGPGDGSGDEIVILMVFLYDLLYPEKPA